MAAAPLLRPLCIALGLVCLAAGPPASAQPAAQEVKLAFIGDQGSGADAEAVLALIREEGADAVIHSGDFDYNDDPAAWDATISRILGEDMPYIASVGNHDDGSFYGGYQELLKARLNRIGIPWTGDLGVASTLSFRGIFIVLTAPDIFDNGDGDSVYAPYIEAALAGTDARWRISSWHKNMRAMQPGGKSDETGWGVYEESRRGGAIIATGHEHSYSRTHLLSEMETQSCAIPNCAVPADDTLALAIDDPDTPADEGRSFAFVSGLGGRSIRGQRNDLGPWFASVYTRDQGADHGALFGVFNYQGDPERAYFYLKDVAGNVPDEFFVSSPTAPTPANQAPSGTIVSPEEERIIEVGERPSFAATASDPDGNLPISYLWTFDDSGLPPSTEQNPGPLAFERVGTFSIRLTVTDALGLSDPIPPSVQITVQDPPPLPEPSFSNVTSEAGLDYLQHAIPPSSASQLDRMTGGAAAADYDRDGDVDLYVTRLDAPDILFGNRGDGTFEDVTREAGLEAFDLASNGAAWGDVDNDGDPDLYVTTFGKDQTRFYLFVNDGRGAFTEEAETRGCALQGPDPHFGFSVAFGDYDLDGWLDIHTTEWRADADNPSGAPSNARLLRNLGAERPGHFEDVTEAAGVVLDPPAGSAPDPAGAFVFSSRFSDLDSDGWPELLVVGDFGTSRLFWNDRDGTFTDGTASAGVGSDRNAVGSDVGDYDGDGELDWIVSSSLDANDPGADGNRLFRNRGDGTFEDATDLVGVRDAGPAAGALFLDLDNDGDLDLVVTSGDTWPVGVPAHQPEPPHVWRNEGPGRMSESSQALGFGDAGIGRGVLRFDYDADGDLDVFLVNNGSGPALYRNDTGNARDWLRVIPVGRESNRDGMGAVVRVFEGPGPPRVREISGGSHFLGQSELAAHIGLGTGTLPVERVEVFWPATSRTTRLENVSRNEPLTVSEPPANDSGGGAAGGGGGGGCGLLGAEPLLLLAALRGLRSRRRSTGAERLRRRAATSGRP